MRWKKAFAVVAGVCVLAGCGGKPGSQRFKKRLRTE